MIKSIWAWGEVYFWIISCRVDTVREDIQTEIVTTSLRIEPTTSLLKVSSICHHSWARQFSHNANGCCVEGAFAGGQGGRRSGMAAISLP